MSEKVKGRKKVIASLGGGGVYIIKISYLIVLTPSKHALGPSDVSMYVEGVSKMVSRNIPIVETRSHRLNGDINRL